MNRLVALLGAVVMTLAGMMLVAPAAAGAAPYCGITWGSQAQTGGAMSSAPITNVRAGRHACFDRMVVDVAGSGGGYYAKYTSAVRSDGSGHVVPLRGGAFLEVIATNPSYNEDGDSTYNPRNRRELVNLTGFRTFRQVADAGSFEGQTTFGLGVRARLPYRVFELPGPGTGSRLVVDVAHQW